MDAELFASGCYGENNFTVDDLFDFSKEDEAMSDSFLDNLTGNSSDSSMVTVNSSVCGGETQFSDDFGGRSLDNAHFAGELCVPDDDVAELEWLSNFVDDSFSNDSSQISSLHILIPTDTSSSMARPNSKPDPPAFASATSSFPGKARSKRSRVAPCDWSSRLLLLQSGPKTAPARRRDAADVMGRTCLHCGSDKTPQWRLGPMGPKTLCNACGVRYKSGRLVPEYRPASSPTFVATKHSNSHRKVLELRRQKEFTSLCGSNGGNYLMNNQHHYYNGLNYGDMM